MTCQKSEPLFLSEMSETDPADHHSLRVLLLLDLLSHPHWRPAGGGGGAWLVVSQPHSQPGRDSQVQDAPLQIPGSDDAEADTSSSSHKESQSPQLGAFLVLSCVFLTMSHLSCHNNTLKDTKGP